MQSGEAQITEASSADERPGHSSCRPFLKWAGGKTQLLDEISSRIPASYNRYIEPFLGSGALFFRLNPARALLSDLNQELIETYCVVRDAVELLILDLAGHIYDKDYFYKVRNSDRAPDFEGWSPVQRASRVIYLNKTCFNGLYRVNSKGQFNTPFGRYSNPRILDAKNLRACSHALKAAEVVSADFAEVAERAERGDFVYFDPPYMPLSATSSFTAYARGGFPESEQIRLRDLCRRLTRSGVKFLLSNSASEAVVSLYSEFRIESVQATRAINAKAANRGRISELLVRNY